ncbi:hypothetical protein ABK040_012326 [Willaertia magna]
MSQIEKAKKKSNKPSEDKLKSPRGFEYKKRHNEDVNTNIGSSSNVTETTKKKRKTRKSTLKRDPRGEKFCAEISEELLDGERLYKLNEILLSHITSTYCKKEIVQETMDGVKQDYISFLNQTIEKYYSTNSVKKPLIKNNLNRIQEELYSSMINNVSKELEEWESLERLIKQDSEHMEKITQKAPTFEIPDDDDESLSSQDDKPVKSISSKLRSSLEYTLLGADQLNIFVEELKQLVRSSNQLGEEIFVKVKEETNKLNGVKEPIPSDANSMLKKVLSGLNSNSPEGQETEEISMVVDPQSMFDFN